MDYKSLAMEMVDLYGYWALFITMFVDTLGIPMPSKTMLVLSGYFTNLGIFEPKLIFAVALAGTMGGFTCGYTIGNKLGLPFIEKYGRYVCVTPERLGKLEHWFARFGPYAIIIAYFLPVARSAAPYLCGISNMPFARAFVPGAIGATCWIAVLIYLGFFIGLNMERMIFFLAEHYPHLIMGGLAVLVIAVTGMKIKKRHRTEDLE